MIDHAQIAPGDAERVAGVMDIVSSRINLDGLKVLDLACRSGAFASAFAGAGADVLGIEGRPANLDMAYPGPRYILGDVRDLDRHVSEVFDGPVDVTLCLGILYHLGAEDAVALLRGMRDVTSGFAVIDTHIGAPAAEVAVDGHSFNGQWYGEPPGMWSALGNPQSFWFTPDSLDDAVRLAGWTQIEHHPGIRWPGEPGGRHWLVIS